MIGCCILVGTCVLLGMTWLRELWLGLPIGLWLIIGTYTLSLLGQPRENRIVFRLNNRLRDENSAAANYDEHTHDVSMSFQRASGTRSERESVEGNTSRSVMDTDDSIGSWAGSLSSVRGPIVDPDKPLSTIERVLLRAGDAVGSIIGLVNTSPVDAGFVIKSLERIGWPERPIRVGLCVRKELSSWILSSDGVCDVQWVRVNSQISPKKACDVHVLDAVVIEDELGHVTLISPELDRRPAGWSDWSSPLPLSYGNAFALRFDTADTVLGRSIELRAADGPMLRAMIELSAVLSRNEHRMDASARWRGRRPFDVQGARFNARVVEACWANLGRAVGTSASIGRETETLSTAMRILSAYLATTDGCVDMSARREGIELAHRFLPEETNIALRTIAARVASFDDEEAFELATSVLEDIRKTGEDPSNDPWAYLLSELHCSVPSHLALGRLAAGIVLVFGRARLSKMAYLREDLTEDLQHTTWLVDRESDVAMLIRLMRELEAARTANGQDVTHAATTDEEPETKSRRSVAAA